MIWNPVLQEVHGIITCNTDIGQFMGFKCLQKVTDAGFVNLDANEIFSGFIAGHLPGGIAITKSNLDNKRGLAAKQLLKI